MFKQDTLMHVNNDLLMEYANTPVGCLTPTILRQLVETHKHYMAMARGSDVPEAVLVSIQAHIEDSQKKLDAFEAGEVEYVDAVLILDKPTQTGNGEAPRQRRRPSSPQ